MFHVRFVEEDVRGYVRRLLADRKFRVLTLELGERLDSH